MWEPGRSQTPESKDCPGSSPATYYDGPDKEHDHQPFLLSPSSVSAVLGKLCQYVRWKLALADHPEGGIVRAPAWNRDQGHHARHSPWKRGQVIHGNDFLTGPMNKSRSIPVARARIPCYLFPL